MKKNRVYYKRETCHRIRELTAEKGMTRLELSKRSGVSYGIVHEAMKGTANLRDSTIGRLAEALGTTFAYLAGNEDKVKQEKEHGVIKGGMVPEKAEAYGHTSSLTLHELIKGMANQLGVSEQEIIERVVSVLRKKKNGY